MKIQANKTKRIHSLDSLRAIMMMLGLVIHSAITYIIKDMGSKWSLKDPNTTSLICEFIVELIHTFRMPIFFVIAGFFGAMLFYERTPRKMVKNRISRIVLPFIVFVVLLWPTIVFSFAYTGLLFGGSDSAFETTLSYFANPLIFIPLMTFHLWFLYYLAIITFVSVGLGLLFDKIPTVSNLISITFDRVIQKPILRVICFASLTVIVYFVMGTSEVATSNSFIPEFNTFLFHFFFYLIGWVLYKSKQLLDTMMKLDWVCALVGLALFTVLFFIKESLSYELTIIVKSMVVWLLFFGITGLFIRYGSGHSPKMRYISDSSYWVYLIHLPFTAIIPSFIADWPIHAIFKFLIVMSSTGIICFVSYHYLVRSTFIGKFLNGRKYSKKLSDIIESDESNKLKLALDN